MTEHTFDTGQPSEWVLTNAMRDVLRRHLTASLAVREQLWINARSYRDGMVRAEWRPVPLSIDGDIYPEGRHGDDFKQTPPPGLTSGE